MMKNKFFWFLTASRFSRAVYGVAKTLVFLMIIIAYMPNLKYFDGMSIETFMWFMGNQDILINIANILVYVTVAMCVIRGIPVLIESKNYINADDK